MKMLSTLVANHALLKKIAGAKDVVMENVQTKGILAIIAHVKISVRKIVNVIVMMTKKNVPV